MEQAFKNLHAAALRISTLLLGEASAETVDKLGVALEGGASIVLELGPLPDVRTVSLTLVEHEGRRQRIVTQTVEAHSLN